MSCSRDKEEPFKGRTCWRYNTIHSQIVIGDIYGEAEGLQAAKTPGFKEYTYFQTHFLVWQPRPDCTLLELKDITWKYVESSVQSPLFSTNGCAHLTALGEKGGYDVFRISYPSARM